MPRITMTTALTDQERNDLNAGVLNATVLRELLDASAKADMEFRQYAAWYDIDPDAAGVEFESQGRKFRVTGIEPNRPKFPVSVEEVGSGKSFKFTRDVAKKINAATAARRGTG